MEKGGRRQPADRTARGPSTPCAVRDPEHGRKHRVREPGDPTVARGAERRGPHREAYGHTPMMHDRGKSDSWVVPMNSPNNAAEAAAEVREGSELAKGNSPDGHDTRTQRRTHRRMASSEYVRRHNQRLASATRGGSRMR